MSVAIGTWSVACFVLVYSYKCTLFSYLSVEYTTPEINSLKDLAHSRDINLAIYRSTISEVNLLVMPLQ